MPDIYLASALTRGENVVCVTSILNWTEKDQTVDLPWVDLQSLDEEVGSLTLTFSAVANSDERLTKLRNQMWLDHLKNEERATVVKICEEYNYIPFAE